MQSSSKYLHNSIKPFYCPLHPSEEIQRVCTDPYSETSLQCIECILHTQGKLSRDKFCPIAEFVNFAAQQYKTGEGSLSFREPPPGGLVDFLAYEETKTKALAKHIEREKQRVQHSFNSLLEEFTMLCHHKKEEILSKLDMQLILLKNNYAFYKSKIDKYYHNKNQDFDKDSLIEKINQCQNTLEMEILVKNIKEDILKSNDSDNYLSKEEEIKEGLKNFAQELNRQSNAIPRSTLNDLTIIQKSFEEVKKLMEEFSEINDPITEISGRDLSLDSKIITKAQDSALLRKWLVMSGKTNKPRLLYRGSRDGFDANTFHTKCDDAEATLTIVKSTSGNIFGGYSDQSWKVTNNYKTSNNCWLFSIDHKEIYPVKKNNTQAIYTYSSYGPTFGGGHDLYIYLYANGSGSYSNLGHSYECNSSLNPTEKQSRLAGSYQFAIEEVEVYAVLGRYSRSIGCDTLDSLILDPTKDLPLIKSWTSKLKNTELQLIYRGSRDGFDAQGFHTFCDDQGPTLIVCKAAGSGKVFGGYTSQNWSKSGGFISDKDAFLFSVTSSTKHTIKDREHAIYCNGESGPIFGEGYDLFIAADSHKNAECTSALGTTYKVNEKVGDLTEYLAGEAKFKLQEIEVFKVSTNFNYRFTQRFPQKLQDVLRSSTCNTI